MNLNTHFLIMAVASLISAVTAQASTPEDQFIALVNALPTDVVSQETCDASPGLKLLTFTNTEVPWSWHTDAEFSFSIPQAAPPAKFISTTEVNVAAGVAAALITALLLGSLWLGSFAKLVAWLSATSIAVAILVTGLGTYKFNQAYLDMDNNPKRVVEFMETMTPVFDHAEIKGVARELGISSNPAQVFAERTVVTNLQRLLNQGEWQQAADLAHITVLKESSGTQALRQAALGLAAQHSLDNGRLETAFEYVDTAYAINEDDMVRHTLDELRIHLAMRIATAGSLESAEHLLAKVSPTFNDPIIGEAFGLLARQRVVEIFATGNTQDNITIAGTALREYARRTMSHNVPLTTRAKCDLLEIATSWGDSRLNLGDSKSAINLFEAASRLNPEDAVIGAMLPVAYWQRGIDLMVSGNTIGAVGILRQAVELRPDVNELVCDTAAAEVTLAEQNASGGRVDYAIALAHEASSKCPSDPNIESDVGAVYLAAAESELRSGNYSNGYRLFEAAREYMGEVADMISSSHHEATALHEKLKRKLRHLSRWAPATPSWTGLACAKTEHGECSELAVFNGQTFVGTANRDLSEVYFSKDDIFIMDMDPTVTGYELWQRDAGGRSTVLWEVDNDRRLDRKQVFEGSRLVSDEKLSGRITAIPTSVAIAQENADVFSAPDAYVAAYLNGRFLGRTDAMDNTHYPRFRGYTYEHKNGDCFQYDLWDEDVLTADDFIDAFKWCGGLPRPGRYIGSHHQAAIDLVVVETTLPGGWTPSEHENLENVFRSPSLLNESKELSRLLRRANQADASSRTKSSILAFVAPEAIIAGFYRRASIAAQLGVGLLSYAAIDEAVSSQDG